MWNLLLTFYISSFGSATESGLAFLTSRSIYVGKINQSNWKKI